MQWDKTKLHRHEETDKNDILGVEILILFFILVFVIRKKCGDLGFLMF